MPNELSPLADFTGGTEWIIDASGCNAADLRDEGLLRQTCDDLVGALGLNVVGEPQVHGFPRPGGVTALYLLSESHLACHTYPEFGFATFNLYCCRQRARWAWEDELARRLGANSVKVRQIARDIDSRFLVEETRS